MADTPTAAFSIRIRARLDNVPGTLGRLTSAVGAVGGNIAGLTGFEAKAEILDEDMIINCRSEAHQREVLDAIEACDGVELLSWEDRTFTMHEGGKIEVLPLCSVGDRDDLSMAYTPGVARVCMDIAKDPAKAHEYTIKRNTVAIVSDGTAVLGLGDIGAVAAMPVMEGKALLFKEFAGVDAFPVCLDVSSLDEIVETVIRIAPAFGGINLEDIAAPGAFEVEERLDARLDIPVFHDDQHGTAVVTTAALQNALEVVGKDMTEISVVIAGVGAAGVAITKMLQGRGVPSVVGVDRKGAVHQDRDDLNSSKRWFAEHTNPQGLSGSLREVLPGADVFIGVSGPGLLTREDLTTMADGPIVFAMANPDPEIRPEEARGVASVIATGRSDFPNQINNVLAFPGIFRGALDAGATRITDGMKQAAAEAIARAVPREELSADYIVPSVFDKTVVELVAAAVRDAAVADGVIR